LATKGYTAEVERAYARALELCQSAGEIPQLFPVLRGLSSFHGLRTEFGKGVELGERILNLAERLDDIDMKVEGHLVLGYNLGFHKDIQIGLEHLEKGIALYDPNRPRTQRLVLGGNPGVIGLAVSGLLLWMIGFPDRARTRASDAIALARKLDHPFSIAYAHFHSGLLHHWLGNFEIAEARAREVVELAEEYEFVIWSAVGWCLRGAAMVQLGSTGDGLSLIGQGMNVYRGLKTPPVFWPMLLYLHAEACGAASRPADGLPLLNEAMEIASASTSRLLASEFLSLKGDLLLALSPDNAAEAESWFQGAVTNAQQVNASMLELRAAMRLCRLWQQQRKTVEAARLLGDAYAKITEGFSTVDLKQARGLLADLS
jgi:predicted ATPase